MAQLRRLRASDTQTLLDFLDQHLETSLFLVANAEAVGLEDSGQPLQGTYVGSFDDGRMTAVAAHYWNGIVMVQGECGLEEAVLETVRRSGRFVNGLIGPLALVERARVALGMQTRATKKGEPETLYALHLERLRIPPLLAAPNIVCRPPTADELRGFLVDWRTDYTVEALGAKRTAALREEAKSVLADTGRVGWILLESGLPVSFSTFNASARGVVQVGGVFTPPALRGRGYARTVVAGSLLDAREKGATRSVLFTGRTNLAAQRAYEALGYEALGPFGLVLFR